jgi:hypothetical protein
MTRHAFESHRCAYLGEGNITEDATTEVIDLTADEE